MSESESPADRVESRWWYWVGAMVALTIAELGLGMLLVGVTARTLMRHGEPPMAALVVAVPYLVFMLVVRVAFPIAVFYDASAVKAADVGWSPEPWNWTLAAVIGIFLPIVDTLVALYYLYLRHRAIGVP